MGVDRNKLAAIIGGKARMLCTPESDKKIGKMAHNINIGGGYQYLNENNNSNYIEPAFNPGNASQSRMPDHIKQSMLTEVIDMGGPNGELSVLDSMNIPEYKQTKVVEQKQTANNYSQPQGTIDYSIIKAIVNECLNEHFKKQTLNESATIQTIALKEGTISLVDNKGNVFRAKLEKIGNKNDKK